MRKMHGFGKALSFHASTHISVVLGFGDFVFLEFLDALMNGSLILLLFSRKGGRVRGRLCWKCKTRKRDGNTYYKESGFQSRQNVLHYCPSLNESI